MKMSYIYAVLLSGLLIVFSGCGASHSRVILLEGAKKNSSIVVKTQAGEQVLDAPNAYTELSSTTEKPTPPQNLANSEIEKNFGSLIANAPKPPVSFLLYFNSGGSVLTDASLKLLPSVEQAVQERTPCDVNIIGHADKEGSNKHNINISLGRAKSVHEWFVKKNLDIGAISVESYGEEDPLIPTKDGVSEPRNRRVEVLVR